MKMKRLFLKDWLAERMKKPSFRKGFEEEYLRASLALRITELRKKKRLSQVMLAERLHTTQQAVSDIETFKSNNLTLLTLQKIAQALGSRLVVELR